MLANTGSLLYCPPTPTDPAHIPELPQGQAHQSPEEPQRVRSVSPASLHGQNVTSPQPAGSPSVQQLAINQTLKGTGSGGEREEEEDEEMLWELERKRREEKRQLERQEALEREQRELERLEQERLLEEVQQQDLGEESYERAEMRGEVKGEERDYRCFLT
ncbi:hypothetical protein JZ751_027739 [Albula glossodonta]|uniref:Uncharacterized protein n=1 Tax=Albula glossodonta TaxID=121402 RepID=A0A8T2PC37_9TELE|nr:hypothetical protein JZ751_027739 [Albula glossodonta]